MPGYSFTGNEREVIVGNLVRGIQSVAKESSEEILSIIQQAIGESHYNDYCTGIESISYNNNSDSYILSGTATSDPSVDVPMTITIYAYPDYDIVSESKQLEVTDITDTNFKEGIKFHRPLIYLAESGANGNFTKQLPDDINIRLFYLKCGDQIKRFNPSAGV